MRWRAKERKVRPVFVLLLAGASALCAAACASSTVTPVDSGTTVTQPNDAGHTGSDSGDATMMIQQHDAISIFGDTGMTGIPDVTIADSPPPDSPSPGDGHATGDGATKETGADGPDTKVDGAKDAAKDSNSGTKDSSTPKDSSGTCTPVTVVSGTGGAVACPSPVTGMCAPGSLASFTPTAPPPASPQNKCTTAQTQAVFDGCLGPNSSDNACSATDMDCYNCIFTDESASTWGPLVSGTNQIANLNLGGCLLLMEPCNTKCAATFENDLECELAACETNCPVNTQAQETAYNTCATTADGCDPGGCYEYANGQNCASAITGSSHPGSVCFANEGDTEQAFEAQFLAIVPIFCGN